MAQDHYLPLFVGDFLASTATWSGPERGLYLQLLMMQWATKNLPADLSRLARVTHYSLDEFQALWPIMADKFKINGAFMANPRLEAIRTRNTEIQEARSQAGMKGAAARWVDNKTDGKRIADANDKGNGKIMPSDPIRSESEENQSEERVRGAGAPSRATRIPADFSLTPERRKFAESENLDPERTLQTFMDHWKAAVGAKARKMDWDATWKNWCRRQQDFKPARKSYSPLDRLTWRPEE